MLALFLQWQHLQDQPADARGRTDGIPVQPHIQVAGLNGLPCEYRFDPAAPFALEPVSVNTHPGWWAMNNGTGAGSSLTERQRQVLERLDRRVPIKVIASELGVSPSRINQHIAALKRLAGANDLSELVACYREGRLGASPPPSTKGAWTKSQLPETVRASPSTSWAEERELSLTDMDAFPLEAPWTRTSEPTVVPGVLDGDHAIVRRLVAMWGMAVAIVCAILLTIAAATTLSRLLDDVAEVPVDETQSAE